MRYIEKKSYYNTLVVKLIKGIKLVAIPGSSQFIIQAIGLISGLLIIRLLPTKEYALYTIANTMLGTMVLLADSGITTGVFSQGGKVWQNKKKLGAVINTGLDLRKKFAVVTLVIVTPILIYLLKHNGASWLMCLLISFSLIPAFLAELSDAVLEIAPKLKQDLGKLQKNQISASLGRILMITVFLFIFPWTFVALLGSGIPRIWANVRLRKISAKYADLDENPDPVVKKDILAMVKRIIPGAVYYCFSGQITIWLISIIGSTTAIAKLGALGRISMILNFIAVLFSMLIVPRFARMPNLSTLLLKSLSQILIGLFIINMFITLFVFLFPTVLLWIIGAKYSNLENELLLNIIGSSIGLMAGSVFNLSLTRGWTINPVLSISISVISIILGAIFINISTLRGILIFNIFIAVMEFLMHILHILYRLFKLKKLELI